MSSAPAPLAARVAAFASAAALSTTQDVVRLTLPALGPDAVPETVAEETLVLVSAVTARAVEVGLRETDAVEAAGSAVAEVPFLYHDFLLGAEMVAQGAEGDVEPDQSVYERLARKAEFYGVHFPAGRFPGPRALGDKLPLWMGRVSPPGLPTSPDQRLGDLGIADVLATHARLVMAFAQQAAG
ncbi:MAG TPA: hypothetical protein EYQ24_07150 [Bacteroidetes bacterium]|nr:hypothetical protein [Bacteroidota bacterium]HIL58097.1 hypothetical protein [Rhodothermales bacterium]